MRTFTILIITLCSSSLISAQLPNYFSSNNNFPNFPSNAGFSGFQQSSNAFSQYQPYSNRIPSAPQVNHGYSNFPQAPSAGFANYQSQSAAIAQPQSSPAGPGLTYSWNINHAAAQQQQPYRQVQSYSSQPQALSPPSFPQSFSSSIPQTFNSQSIQPYRPQLQSYSPPQSFSAPSIPQSYSVPSLPQSYRAPSIPQSYSAPSLPQSYSAQSIPQYQSQPAPAPAFQQNYQTTHQVNPQNLQSSQNFNPAPVHYASIGTQLQGDYKFGYHTGDGGSFREETRLPDGTVQGAYGFVDANGKQRIVKYSAGKEGFKAEGDDVPLPAAPVGPSSAPQSNPISPFNLDDGQAYKSFMQG